MVSWGLAAGRILGLLRAGIYLSAAELTQAPDKVLHEAMDALLMTARDLTKEGRDMGLLPQTLAIHDQHKGYPELDEDMVAFAKTDGGLQMLAQEYHAFLDAYYDDPSILRYRLSAYNTHRIGIILNDLPYEKRHFDAQPASCGNAKCSSHKTRSTIIFCGRASKVGWRSIPTSAIPTRRRNVRSSSRQLWRVQRRSRAGYG